MKRACPVLAVLALITAVSTAAGAAVPIRAEDAPLKAPQAAPTSATSTEAADRGLSEKEKALLQKINALKASRWRVFGGCRYDWAGWKLMPDGVRTTSVQCGPETTAATTAGAAPAASVAVHCDTLKISLRSGDQAWSGWRLPLAASESKERGGEDRMVASLCANARPIPRPQTTPQAVNPATRTTAAPAARKPMAKPPQKPAATRP